MENSTTQFLKSEFTHMLGQNLKPESFKNIKKVSNNTAPPPCLKLVKGWGSQKSKIDQLKQLFSFS